MALCIGQQQSSSQLLFYSFRRACRTSSRGGLFCGIMEQFHKIPMNADAISLEGASGVLRMVEGGQVAAGGQRRLKPAGYDRFEARERVAGIPIPVALKHF